MISQGENGNIYVANSMGLLEYTGAEWNLYPVPNNTIVRSVEVVGDRIYTGAYMEIGFWKRDETGILQYESLVPAFKNELKDGEQFWNIKNVGDILIFQSLEGLYLYNTKSGEISTIKSSPSQIRNLFRAQNTIYFQVFGEGLYTMHNNLPNLILPYDLINDQEIMHLSQKGKDLNIVTRSGEFFKWDGEDIQQNYGNLKDKIRNRSVYSALTLEDNSMIVGTVEDGVYYVDEGGEPIFHFNQQNGIINNTVLSLFKDSAGNVWAGLDNGLSIINLESPIKLFQDNYGNLGSVYASHQSSDYLYLGTNQGLFFKRTGEAKFNFIEGTNGQVWSLQELEGIIFCGHNSGTFIVEGEIARKIYDQSGTWVVKEYESKPGYFIQGHYNGLSLLRSQDGEISTVGTVKDFPHSSKFFFSEPNGDIWVGNEHKGVYRLRLDDQGTSISSLKNYTFDEVSGITSSLFKFNDTIYYSTTAKLFQYNEKSDKFREDGILSKLFKKAELISGKIVSTGGLQIWGFSQNSIFHIEPAQLGEGYTLSKVHLPNDLKSITRGYENITLINEDSYLLGVSNGYLKFKNSPQNTANSTIRIDKIFTTVLDETPRRISLKGTDPLHYKDNNISFNFSLPEYRKFLAPVYSYRLVGLSFNWSDWSPIPTAAFKNLTFGTYEFQVKGKIGEVETAPATYKFQVARPWFISLPALVIYVILFIIILVMVHKAYKRKHLRMIKENEKELKMKNLEAEKTIIELQNEQLEKDMVNKNKELAISTMNLIKKNEFLTSIKDKLKGSKESQEVRSVIRTIDKDISEEDNWNFFKEAFNNADKDFFKKIKKLHPELTSNDLKLCAYLRLNLSSKEIAPLLNISVKSVEIKRYRLRKKMDLPREVNLSDHILGI